MTPRYSPPLNIKPWIKSSSIRIFPSRKYSLLDLSLGFCIDSSLLFSKTFYFCTKLRTLFYTILLSPISYAIDMILTAGSPQLNIHTPVGFKAIKIHTNRAVAICVPYIIQSDSHNPSVYGCSQSSVL